MQTSKVFKTAWLFTALSIAGWTTTQAQTTAVWTGPASGGEWNTANSWSTGVVPGLDVDGTTNVLILGGTNVSYTFPMTAATIGILTNNGILNVNTNGFNATQIVMTCPAGNNANKQLNATNAGTVINVSGNFGFLSNSVVTLSGGATLTVQGSLLIGSGIGGGASSGNSGSIGIMTNSGGFLYASATSVNPANAAENSLFVISGGTNNLGNTKVERSSAGSGGYNALGSEGLIIYNGLVIMTNLNVGGSAGNSWLTTLIAGGTVTNFGAGMSINCGTTTGRPARLLQTGGLFVVPDPEVVNPNPTTAGALSAVYSIQGGTNIVGGFYFGASNSTVAATVNITNAATIYVGSQGIASNGAVVFASVLKAGGLFGATAPWTGSTTLSLGGSGAFTFQTADMNGNPNNITLNGALSGTASTTLNITGGGTLTLGATNTYGGTTLIKGGTLTLAASGALASPLIIVGPGTTFDVSAISSGFVLNNLQTLTGSGTVNGAVALASGATITSGSNTLTGTLTLNNSLTETNGGAVNHFALSGAPNPNNDLIVVGGDLNVFGATNSIDVAGTSLVPGTNYIVIQYGGNFNGGLTNFVVTTAFGALSNDPVGKTISFIPAVSQRGTTNTVWIGNPVNTNWDNLASTNWLIAGSGALTTFVPGDSVQFTDLGASNSPVNIVGTVSPTTILVNSQSNYVIASTSGGWIAGTTGLTTTNTGTLTILTTNTYTGSTIIDGGSTLAVSQLALIGFPSAVGESDSLVINNGTLIYSGPNVSIDRGATLGNASSAVNISANGSLTLGGTLTGNGGLTMAGPGTLIMNGASSYAGVTTFSNGILQVSSTIALGTNNFNFYGGTLKFSGEPGQEYYANIFNAATTGTVIFNDGNSDGVIGTSGGGGGFSGTGILSIDVPNAGGYCTINAHTENYAGTIHVTDDSLGVLRLNSGGNSTSVQECTGGTNLTLDLGNGSVSLINRNGAASYNNYDLGALRGGSGTFLKGSATGGSPSVYSIGALNSSTIYSGTIANGTGPSGATTAITKVGTGTLTLLGESTYTGPTIVSNGVLALSYNPTNSNDGEIFGTPTITIAAGAVIDVSGEAADPGSWQLAYSSPQILQGNGTVNGTLDASSASSTISPGGGISGSIGKLTVSRGILAGGTEWMKINRAASPNCDQLVSSTENLDYFGGTFVVTNIGPRLQAGDTFKLCSGVGTGSGSPDTIILPGYYTWDTSQLIANGTVTVTAVLPLPSVTKADFSGLASGAITLNTTNGIAGTSVNVLSSTNLALPFSSWKTVTNTTFDANGNLADPNSGNPGLTIYLNPTNSPSFYLLQTLGF